MMMMMMIVVVVVVERRSVGKHEHSSYMQLVIKEKSDDVNSETYSVFPSKIKPDRDFFTSSVI